MNVERFQENSWTFGCLFLARLWKFTEVQKNRCNARPLCLVCHGRCQFSSCSLLLFSGGGDGYLWGQRRNCKNNNKVLSPCSPQSVYYLFQHIQNFSPCSSFLLNSLKDQFCSEHVVNSFFFFYWSLPCDPWLALVAGILRRDEVLVLFITSL